MAHIKLVDTPNPSPVPPEAIEFVSDYLLPNLKGTDENDVIAVLLGGSFSKGMNGPDSDLDLRIVYAPTIKNLLAFAKISLHVNPVGFEQLKTVQGASFTKYQFKDYEIELTTTPLRAVNDTACILKQIQKNNVKELHDLIVQYPIYETDRYKKIREFVLSKEYQWSLTAGTNYFTGYMKAQLNNHSRKKDWYDRELQAIEKNTIKPVVKHAIEGLYIGLSGLLFVDEFAVSRDFSAIWNRYRNLFDVFQQEFIDRCFSHKTGRGRIIENVPIFVGKAGLKREEIFNILTEQINKRKDAFIDDFDVYEQTKRVDELQNELLRL